VLKETRGIIKRRKNMEIEYKELEPKILILSPD
jgi:hypothetical protein